MATHEEVALPEGADVCDDCGDAPVTFVTVDHGGEESRWCSLCLVTGIEENELPKYVVRIVPVAVDESSIFGRRAEERMYLRKLAQASDDVKREARRMEDAAKKVREDVERGFHAEFGHYQTCFDLVKAVERRKAAAEAAVEFGCDRDAVTLASKGGNVR